MYVCYYAVPYVSGVCMCYYAVPYVSGVCMCGTVQYHM